MTDNPAIGVLVQPFDTVKDNLVDYDNIKAKAYLSSSHVKFLESGGARVVPIDYSLPFAKIEELLSQINGIYIPGETEALIYDESYVKTVIQIIRWA